MTLQFITEPFFILCALWITAIIVVIVNKDDNDKLNFD